MVAVLGSAPQCIKLLEIEVAELEVEVPWMYQGFRSHRLELAGNTCNMMPDELNYLNSSTLSHMAKIS